MREGDAEDGIVGHPVCRLCSQRQFDYTTLGMHLMKVSPPTLTLTRHPHPALRRPCSARGYVLPSHRPAPTTYTRNPPNGSRAGAPAVHALRGAGRHGQLQQDLLPGPRPHRGEGAGMSEPFCAPYAPNTRIVSTSLRQPLITLFPSLSLLLPLWQEHYAGQHFVCDSELCRAKKGGWSFTTQHVRHR